MRFAFITGLLAVATCSATAQSTTDVVQRANFVLKGTMQTSSGVKSVRLANKDILAALNATGAYNFGRRATLLFVSSDDELPALIVREGTGRQTTNTDVGDFFGVTEIGDEVRSPDDSTRWQTWNFAFDNGNTNETAFQLWGATTIQRGGMPTRRTVEGASSPSLQSNVRGVGRVQGAITIFSGTISGANSTQVSSER
jgi:hypothetical protein